ncbi:MAG TPA: exo-beta-N-acetylmuramidase NamZ domain-containing protein, partial [Blastocatellia bacterium]|nr:exo-beta-N-acetylmuramidase NamZ domain-containing protein [Blastocatellia bacterium]
LTDTVSVYIPEFGRMGKESITVEQLMTHRAGLPPDDDISDYVGVSADPMNDIYNLRPVYTPGTRFVYSDVGYIVAAEIIRRVSGKPLDQFAEENVFKPLGMKDTRFLPFPPPFGKGRGQAGPAVDPAYLARIAPTQLRDGHWMHGEVHDPRSWAFGGVAGHAGLFSTASDMAVFCQMILNSGEYNSVRILSPYGVKRMTSSIGLPELQMRGIGWDINTPYSSNRGDLFPVGSFGHTGFTGTSIWIDPASQPFVVILTDRVHPDGQGSDIRLRSLIASIVAGAIVSPPYVPTFETGKPSPARPAISHSAPAGLLHPVLTGVDVLERDNFKELEGRRIGLITNQTGRDRAGHSDIDVLAAAKNLKLVALFAPEHGLRGADDNFESDSKDARTGLPVYSLYKKDARAPSDEALNGIDALVFDIQDVGVRFYTYIATCGYAMEAAAKHKIKMFVLDRPDPLGGYEIEGPVADEEYTHASETSFTCYYPLPVRYGLTVGELAILMNSEGHIGADLTIIKMEGWRRADYYDGTGLEWMNPSPNIRNLTEALLYPGIGLLESTNLSVGRGTDTPFELVGAPWIDGTKLSGELNRAGLSGVRFVPVGFTPKSSVYEGQECSGVSLIVTDRSSLQPVAVGIEIAVVLHRLYPMQWRVARFDRLLANRAVLGQVKSDSAAREIVYGWQPGLAQFARLRMKYFLY